MQKVSSIITIKNKKQNKRKRFKDNYLNLVYMIPVLLGIVCFTIFPMVISLVYSLCDFNLLDPTWTLGEPSLKYFKQAFTTDWKNLLHCYYITFRSAIVVNAISMVGSYIVALILNQKIKGVSTFRILYYLPCLIPGLAGSLLWNGITKETGYFNHLLVTLGMNPYTFYSKDQTVFPTMILLSGWGFSGGMIMWLAQFKNIPNELYEEADLSGAGYFQKLFHITIPMSTSMVFYMLIMNTIGTLQSFGYYPQYVDNGKLSELKFVGIHIYEQAYIFHNISYACALSWILFGVIGVLTLLIFKTSNQWVYYAEDN